MLKFGENDFDKYPKYLAFHKKQLSSKLHIKVFFFGLTYLRSMEEKYSHFIH